MKQFIKKLVNKAGYSISKYKETGHTYRDLSKEKEWSYFETDLGHFYLPRNSKNDIVAQAIRRGLIFESEIVSIAQRYIKENSIVLDVGSNYGQMSVIFSKCSDKVSVYSFEAQTFVFNILEKNIKANNCKNVIPIFKAVYNINDIELIFSKPDFKNYGSYGSVSINNHSSEGDRVKSITIDSLVFDKAISFMKIDVQGCDLFALQGAVNTIKKHKMPIIFEYEEGLQSYFGTCFQDYIDFFREVNYRFEKQILGCNYLMLPNL